MEKAGPEQPPGNDCAMGALNTVRAWVIENGLVDHTGHHFNNSVGLSDACARRGIDARFLVNRRASADALRMLDATPAFEFTPYDSVSTDPLAGPLENLIILGNAFAQDLVGALPDIGADDLLIVPTTLQHELYGCALACAQWPSARRPRFAFTFIVENFLAPGTRQPGALAALYRFAVRQFARVVPDARRVFGANGAGMAESLGYVLSQPVAVFPIPKCYPPALPCHPGDRPRVAILGHSRAEKGFHLVPAIVARCPDIDFVVQIAPADAETQWHHALPAMRSAPNVELIAGALSSEAYYTQMSRCDIVLLPYDSAQMPFRSSGVFAEAVASAKIAVVPAGTWMAAHLAAGHGAGVVFEVSNADAISTALSEAARRWSRLRSDAEACAPAWRVEQSADAYLDGVLLRLGLSFAPTGVGRHAGPRPTGSSVASLAR